MSALRGIRVLELAESVSGEYCGKLLSDFGAEVIKIEQPISGSPTRGLGPFAGDEPGLERSGLFAYLNTGKQSVALDTDGDAGAKTLAQLLQRVDVVIDDHPAEWLAAVGLGRDTVHQAHPSLIFCSVTNFGLAPPEDRLYAEDINVFHSSGWGYHTPSGADPVLPPLKGAGRFLPSYEAGLEASLCVCAALFEREESGQGQFIEISKQEVLASRMDYVLAQMLVGEMDVSTDRTALDLGGPAGIFACRDGYAYIWMSAPAHWQGLSELLGEPEWMADFPENWLERECTPERVAICREQLSAWLATQNKHEVAEKAQKLGVILVAVNNGGDLMDSEQYQYRGFFAELEHPVIGKANYPTVPYQLSETPAKPSGPAPMLGQHSEQTLAALGGGEQ